MTLCDLVKRPRAFICVLVVACVVYLAPPAGIAFGVVRPLLRGNGRYVDAKLRIDATTSTVVRCTCSLCPGCPMTTCSCNALQVVWEYTVGNATYLLTTLEQPSYNGTHACVYLPEAPQLCTAPPFINAVKIWSIFVIGYAVYVTLVTSCFALCLQYRRNVLLTRASHQRAETMREPR